MHLYIHLQNLYIDFKFFENYILLIYLLNNGIPHTFKNQIMTCSLLYIKVLNILSHLKQNRKKPKQKYK